MTAAIVETSAALASFEDEDALTAHVSTSSLATITKSEIDAQLDAAHRFPRSIKQFLADAESMCTLSEEVAGSCMYSVPRAGKLITGPSVRLAEICASAYGNLQIATRILEPEETEAVAQGAAWDMQKNLRITIEARRRIVDKYGKRYSADMIATTGAAAASVALRNAIFKVVPRAYVDTLYERARAVAVGKAETLPARRDKLFSWISKKGITTERVLARLGRAAVEDVGLEDLEKVVGLITAIKEQSMSAEDAFPTTGAAAKVSTDDLDAKIKEKAAAKEAAKKERAAVAKREGANVETGELPATNTPETKKEPPARQNSGEAAHTVEDKTTATVPFACFVCEKPITDPADGVPGNSVRGANRHRHAACSPFAPPVEPDAYANGPDAGP
jgi:hypothetical protein